MKKISIIFFVIFFSNTLFAKSISRNTSKPPPKIIRTCCGFGSEVKLFGVPFATVTEVTSLDRIGSHVFLGNQQEGNGIIYTKKGGFIDLGHLRDVADWTNYVYTKIIENKGTRKDIQLGYEGGHKTLKLNITEDISNLDASYLAGQIAYEISLWHEIGTWFGASYIPLIPERYSAFSPEDIYSNLTGAVLGINAINSVKPFEEAMTDQLNVLLKNLEAVDTKQGTLDAMENINGLWWTRDKMLPSKNVLIKRFVSSNFSLTPWLIPNSENIEAVDVSLPNYSNINISDMYTISYRINGKLPDKKIFIAKKKFITQKDFPEIISYIKTETDILEIKNIQKRELKLEKNIK